MNLAVLLKYPLLILLLTFFQVAVAQSPSEASITLDALVHQFIDQHSVTLTPDELVGHYALTKDFWQESIHLKDNGRFTVARSRGFNNLSMNRGNWQINGNEILLTGKKSKETAHLIKYNGNVCLLTDGSIERWKAIAKQLQTAGGKLAYDPFSGTTILYKKEK
ncbi:MAG: hypothetical protein AAF632_19105 [Bacteroidota bacterium]